REVADREANLGAGRGSDDRALDAPASPVAGATHPLLHVLLDSRGKPAKGLEADLSPFRSLHQLCRRNRRLWLQTRVAPDQLGGPVGFRAELLLAAVPSRTGSRRGPGPPRRHRPVDE